MFCVLRGYRSNAGQQLILLSSFKCSDRWWYTRKDMHFALFAKYAGREAEAQTRRSVEQLKKAREHNFRRSSEKKKNGSCYVVTEQ